MTRFEGVFPALLTPFTAGGFAIDEPGVRRMVDYLIDAGVHGLFVGGTTGEGISLTVEERQRLAEVVMDQAARRCRVIFLCAANQPWDAVALARQAEQLGADGAALLPPWYYAVDAKGLARHIQAVAEAVPGLPIFLYNIPARTGNAFTAEVVKQLREACPHLAGIKESGRFENMKEWLALQDERFTVFNGNDLFELGAYQLGARALVASFANIIPQTFVAFHAAACAGNWEEAERLQERIRVIVEVVDNENQIANLKAVLRSRDLPAGCVRPPLRELERWEEEDLLHAVEGVM